MEKPSHNEVNSITVKEKGAKEHVKCQHKKEVGGITGKLKDEKGALQTKRIEKGIGNSSTLC